jgi:hypothetical protein
MLNDETPCCGLDILIDGVLDIDVDPATGARYLNFRGCCEEGAAMVESWGVEEVLGCSYEEACAEVLGVEPQRVEAGQAIRRGREEELAEADGLLVDKLEVEVATGAAQGFVFDRVLEHHRHHGKKRPSGWHFGLIARRGSVVVGVAICGRPVSRHLQAQGYVEVTRCCTWGDDRLKRDVASALYRAAVREYERRGCVWTTREGRTTTLTTLVTYTLQGESGGSLRGAGFQDEGAAGGGSWARTDRPRVDHAPTEPKNRWTIALRAPARSRAA